MELYVTEYGTFRCDKYILNGNLKHVSIKDIPIKKFLKKLDKTVGHIKYRFDAEGGYVLADATLVAASQDDKYLIRYKDVNFDLDISKTGEYYPMLKDGLDKLDKKCALARHTIDVIDHFEDPNADNPTNWEDIKLYLEHLEKFYKTVSFRKAIVLSPCVLLPAGFAYGGSIIDQHFVLGSLTCALPLFGTCMGGILSAVGELDVTNPFKASKVIKLKMDAAKRKLGEAPSITTSVSDENVKNTDKTEQRGSVYFTGVVSFMEQSLDNITGLNRENQLSLLRELREMAVGYVEEFRKMALAPKSEVLTFENSERTAAYHKLSEVTELDFKVADLMKRDQMVNQDLEAGEKLIKRIDNYIAIVDAGEEDIASNAPVKRTLSM